VRIKYHNVGCFKVLSRQEQVRNPWDPHVLTQLRKIRGKEKHLSHKDGGIRKVV